jgi:CheY-like chemotaxis protein
MGEETRGRILVVEDDPEAALFVVHVLANRCRFEVIHTADPLVALRLATDEHWVDQLIATATALIGRGRPLSDDPRRDNLRA